MEEASIWWLLGPILFGYGCWVAYVIVDERRKPPEEKTQVPPWPQVWFWAFSMSCGMVYINNTETVHAVFRDLWR